MRVCQGVCVCVVFGSSVSFVSGVCGVFLVVVCVFGFCAWLVCVVVVICFVVKSIVERAQGIQIICVASPEGSCRPRLRTHCKLVVSRGCPGSSSTLRRPSCRQPRRMPQDG